MVYLECISIPYIWSVITNLLCHKWGFFVRTFSWVKYSLRYHVLLFVSIFFSVQSYKSYYKLYNYIHNKTNICKFHFRFLRYRRKSGANMSNRQMLEEWHLTGMHNFTAIYRCNASHYYSNFRGIKMICFSKTAVLWSEMSLKLHYTIQSCCRPTSYHVIPSVYCH